jgi:hypothetical protein
MKTNRLSKAAFDKLDALGRLETEEYCDIQFCEAKAIQKAPISVHRAGDSERKFCGGCYEAYLIGVQHGRLSENPRAYSRNGARRAGSRKSGKIR